jgi:glycerol-3-phosphate cytidylyltransferase
MRIGIFPMVGDLLHTGHLYALEEAKRECDYLIVLLNCVPEGKQPVETIFERWSRLKFNKEVDEIIPYQGEADLLNIIKTVHHDVRFVGGDYFGKDFTGRDFEENHGIQLCFINRDHGYSSTELKNRIKF